MQSLDLIKKELLMDCPFCNAPALAGKVVTYNNSTNKTESTLYGVGCSDQACWASLDIWSCRSDDIDEAVDMWHNRKSHCEFRFRPNK